jgi:hypothetical protein
MEVNHEPNQRQINRMNQCPLLQLIESRQLRIIHLLTTISNTQRKIMTTATDVKAALDAQQTEINIVIAELNTLAADLAAAIAAGSDSAALTALVTQIQTQTAALTAAAVAADPNAAPPATGTPTMPTTGTGGTMPGENNGVTMP